MKPIKQFKSRFSIWLKTFLTFVLFSSFSLVANSAEIAPYFYTWGIGKVNSLTEARRLAGLTSATYAFIVANGCNMGTSLPDAMADVKQFIADGGSLILGFGGASGPYLCIVRSNG
jgi:hypothetical protein